MGWLTALWANAGGWIMAVVIAVAIGAALWFGGAAHGRRTQLAIDAGKYEALKAGYAEKLADAVDAAQARQQAQAESIAAIDAQHARELQHAKQDADRTIADLRAGAVRLREQWRGCEAAASVPGAAAGTSQPDAAAELRAASAARIIGAAAAADAQIRALQAVIRAERQPP